jgi:hypothetical protein
MIIKIIQWAFGWADFTVELDPDDLPGCDASGSRSTRHKV